MPARLLLLLAVVALATSGCRVRLGTDIAVERGGSGRIEVAVGIDEELETMLERAGVDLLRGLEQVTAAEPTWDVATEDGEDGQVVRLRAGFERPEDLAALTADLQAPLDEEDVRLWDSLSVAVVDEGAIAFEGRAGLLLPSHTGARGAGVDVDGEDLAALLRERGDEYVTYDLRLTLPAPPAESDADEVTGRTLTWRLPVGELRTVSALSEPPSALPLIVAVTAGIAAVVLLVLGTVWWRGRRRHRRRQPAATGRPTPWA